MNASQVHLILSIGTRVVALDEVRDESGRPLHPRGAVGVVIQSPTDYWHSYRVRFADGLEVSLSRRQLAVLSQFQSGQVGSESAGAAALLAEYDLQQYVIYRCVIGSRAYGLDDEQSDTDRRGIYLPPAEQHWSLYGVPEQLDYYATEEVYWEAQKFVVLALKANPNVLECLFTPIVETVTPLAEELLAIREKFLSRLVYQTYHGYVFSQFKKLQADLRNHGQVKWKHVMHLLRLLLAGVQILEEGRLSVKVDATHRPILLAVKRGEVAFEECEEWRRQLHQRFDDALGKTQLPERPDYAAANAWLIKARRSML